MPNQDLIYIAHPIDLGRAKPDLIEYAVGELQALRLTSYNPLGAFNVAGTPSGVISKVNEAAMLTATGAVAFLPFDARSVGVPAEISFLITHGRPTLILSDLDATSWVVAGWAEGLFSAVYDLSEEGISAGLDWLRDRMAYLASDEGRAEVDPIVFGKEVGSAILPTRGYASDAGYDLYTSEDTTIPARGFADVPCGVSVDLPDGTWGQITGRSSTLRKRRVLVAPGVIDEEYTGPLYAGCENLTDEPIVIKKGERVAQLILHDAIGQQYTPKFGTPRTKERGSNGFGSTGV